MGGSFCPCTHFDKRAAKLYLVDSQLDTRLAIVHRKKEERPFFFFFFFLPLFLRLKVAEDDNSKVIYISGQRGPFSFLLDRGFVISRTLDVYLCGRDSPPPFYRLGKRWTTKNFDRPRSRNNITTNRNRRPSLLKREREWVAQRAITLTSFEPRFLFSCKYIISTIKLRKGIEIVDLRY